VSAEGIEPPTKGARTRSEALIPAARPAIPAPSSPPLPPADTSFAEAAARAAAVALAEGDVTRARTLLGDALRALAGVRPLRIVGGAT
jgi:hypothetical protein